MIEEEKAILVASRLNIARRISGLSQAQAAQLLGLQSSVISAIESGIRTIKAEEVSQFANIYAVSEAWLIGEYAEKLSINDENLQFAARDLKKLKPEELDQILTLIAARRGRRANI
jgi:transcriptional regulator with XRE-family HTH domain